MYVEGVSKASENVDEYMQHHARVVVGMVDHLGVFADLVVAWCSLELLEVVLVFLSDLGRDPERQLCGHLFREYMLGDVLVGQLGREHPPGTGRRTGADLRAHGVNSHTA